MAVLTHVTLNQSRYGLLSTGMRNYCMQAWARTGYVWLRSLLSALGDIDPQQLWGACSGAEARHYETEDNEETGTRDFSW